MAEYWTRSGKKVSIQFHESLRLPEETRAMVVRQLGDYVEHLSKAAPSIVLALSLNVGHVGVFVVDAESDDTVSVLLRDIVSLPDGCVVPELATLILTVEHNGTVFQSSPSLVVDPILRLCALDFLLNEYTQGVDEYWMWDCVRLKAKADKSGGVCLVSVESPVVYYMEGVYVG